MKIENHSPDISLVQIFQREDLRKQNNTRSFQTAREGAIMPAGQSSNGRHYRLSTLLRSCSFRPFREFHLCLWSLWTSSLILQITHESLCLHLRHCFPLVARLWMYASLIWFAPVNAACTFNYHYYYMPMMLCNRQAHLISTSIILSLESQWAKTTVPK